MLLTQLNAVIVVNVAICVYVNLIPANFIACDDGSPAIVAVNLEQVTM